MFNPIRRVQAPVTVATSTTAARILTPDNNRGRAIIKNTHGSIVVWLGGSSVTSTDGGVRLAAGEIFVFHGRGSLYAVAASGTPNLAILSETHVANPVKTYAFEAVAVADSATRVARKNTRRMRTVIQNLAATAVTVGNGDITLGQGISLAQYARVELNSTNELYVFGTGTNEVQTVTVDATGGTFTLSFGGQTTTAIAEAAASSAVQTALQALSTIGSGNVAVTGSAGGPFTVTFQGSLANTNVALLTGSNASLTGGASTVTIAVVTAGASASYTVGIFTESM